MLKFQTTTNLAHSGSFTIRQGRPIQFGILAQENSATLSKRTFFSKLGKNSWNQIH